MRQGGFRVARWGSTVGTIAGGVPGRPDRAVTQYDSLEVASDRTAANGRPSASCGRGVTFPPASKGVLVSRSLAVALLVVVLPSTGFAQYGGMGGMTAPAWPVEPWRVQVETAGEKL